MTDREIKLKRLRMEREQERLIQQDLKMKRHLWSNTKYRLTNFSANKIVGVNIPMISDKVQWCAIRPQNSTLGNYRITKYNNEFELVGHNFILYINNDVNKDYDVYKSNIPSKNGRELFVGSVYMNHIVPIDLKTISNFESNPLNQKHYTNLSRKLRAMDFEGNFNLQELFQIKAAFLWQKLNF